MPNNQRFVEAADKAAAEKQLRSTTQYLSRIQREKERLGSQEILRTTSRIERKRYRTSLGRAEAVALAGRRRLSEFVGLPTREEYILREQRLLQPQRKFEMVVGRAGEKARLTRSQITEAIELARAQIAKRGRGPAFYGRDPAVQRYGRFLVSEALRKPLVKIIKPGMRVTEEMLKFARLPIETRRQRELRARLEAEGRIKKIEPPKAELAELPGFLKPSNLFFKNQSSNTGNSKIKKTKWF